MRRVLKDLIVDMEPFFDQYRSILPYLVNDEPGPRHRTAAVAGGAGPLR